MLRKWLGAERRRHCYGMKSLASKSHLMMAILPNVYRNHSLQNAPSSIKEESIGTIVKALLPCTPAFAVNLKTRRRISKCGFFRMEHVSGACHNSCIICSTCGKSYTYQQSSGPQTSLLPPAAEAPSRAQTAATKEFSQTMARHGTPR